MRMKLNVLLAKAEASSKQFAALLSQYIETFTKKQGIFQGKKSDYIPEPGQDDQPQYKGHHKVQSTVDEYLEWFTTTVKEFVDNRFSVEATNATGPKAELIVPEGSFGELTTVELMRLLDLLNTADLQKMYDNLPVRSDTKSWGDSHDPEYAGRAVAETEVREQQNRTTIKGSIILSNPDLDKLKGISGYAPVVVPNDKSVLLGLQRVQEFSGEFTHRRRAEILRRITVLKNATKEALIVANDVAAVPSKMTADKLFNYLHTGKIDR